MIGIVMYEEMIGNVVMLIIEVSYLCSNIRFHTELQ
jgi:hypothetical protein